MLTVSVFYPVNTRMPSGKLKVLTKQPTLFGPKVYTMRTQVLRKNTRVNDPVMIDGKHIEVVEGFTYLGKARVVTTGDCHQEINTRISKANKTSAMLRPVWRTTNLSVHTKIKIFRCNVLSVLLYGAERWKTTVTIQPKLEVFQTKCL